MYVPVRCLAYESAVKRIQERLPVVAGPLDAPPQRHCLLVCRRALCQELADLLIRLHMQIGPARVPRPLSAGVLACHNASSAVGIGDHRQTAPSFPLSSPFPELASPPAESEQRGGFVSLTAEKTQVPAEDDHRAPYAPTSDARPKSWVRHTSALLLRIFGTQSVVERLLTGLQVAEQPDYEIARDPLIRQGFVTKLVVGLPACMFQDNSDCWGADRPASSRTLSSGQREHGCSSSC